MLAGKLLFNFSSFRKTSGFFFSSYLECFEQPQWTQEVNRDKKTSRKSSERLLSIPFMSNVQRRSYIIFRITSVIFVRYWKVDWQHFRLYSYFIMTGFPCYQLTTGKYSHHIETNQLICDADQLIRFYKIVALAKIGVLKFLPEPNMTGNRGIKPWFKYLNLFPSFNVVKTFFWEFDLFEKCLLSDHNIQ